MHADLFQGITESTRWRILESGRVEAYAQKDFLFRKGEPADRFYIMVEGRVRLSLGPGELLAHVASEPNELVGWSSLAENKTYTASAECVGPVKVLRFDSQQLNEILRQDPASGMAFFKNLAAIIGRRLLNSYRAALSAHGLREPPPGGQEQ
jgi:CRP-like cAMP-binding protein